MSFLKQGIGRVDKRFFHIGDPFRSLVLNCIRNPSVRWSDQLWTQFKTWIRAGSSDSRITSMALFCRPLLEDQDGSGNE